MLLSRALNRGYAMRPPAWPIAFGLLNVDALWVMDEVQLMGVGRTTSAQLDRFKRTPAAMPRRSLWMSATIGAPPPGTAADWAQPAPTWMRTPERGEAEVRVHGLGVDDRERLKAVLVAAKKIAAGPRSTADDPAVVNRIASAADGGKLVLVMVNRVARAREVWRRLREIAPVAPLLVHSRFRRRERRAALEALSSPVPSEGRIVVSTQVLEAGVDLDADSLFTEICPWASVVQRLGRLNRRGGEDGRVEFLEIPRRAAVGRLANEGDGSCSRGAEGS